MTRYTGTFDTIIVDALNMFHVYINSVSNKLIKKNGYSTESLISQISFIVAECSHQIFIYLLSLRKYLSDNGTIFIVFDPIKTPTYQMIGGEIYDLKTLEREKRKTAQSKLDKSTEIKDKLDLCYGLDKEISEIEEWAKLLSELNKELGIKTVKLEEIFNQQYFFSQISHQMLLIELIVDRAIQKINNVDIQCIFSESEADFVIKNIAYMFNSQPVLVCSTDTDYLVLLSDLPNVYKTQLTRIKESGIFYPYELWRTQFGEQLTADEIFALATIAGNDYTIHESILSFDVEKYKALLNIDNNFEKLKRCRKIQKYINFTPYGLTTEKQLLSIIQEEQFKKSLEVYKSWRLNCKILNKRLNYDEILNDLIKTLKRHFDKIYDFEVYENCPFNVHEVELTVDKIKEILTMKHSTFSESTEDELLIDDD